MIPGITECPYWTPDDHREIAEAKTFKEIATIGTRVLDRMDGPISQLCGPISTGGFGCPIRNLRLFKRCIEELRARELNPFDQVPLQLGLERLMKEWEATKGPGYCMPILEVVYHAIFDAHSKRGGSRMFFLPYWWKSFGTTWEGRTLTKLGIPIHGFPRHWYKSIICELRELVA